MLVELAVRNLGVIAESRIALGAGMTALTGETGAGKTMVVEALRLLSGGKADPSRVREGAGEAVVEALFALGDTEWVARRVVPASGRSRSYLNGELVTAGELCSVTGGLIEIHGQHSQQALLDRGSQRSALDQYAGIDTGPLDAARRSLAELQEQPAALGGDERARQRELDLLRHQVAEITGVGPVPGEDDALAEEEELLAGALDHREAAAEGAQLLGAESGAVDLLARGAAVLGSDGPFASISERLVALREDLIDSLADLRGVAESIEPDEQHLAEVRARRQQLVELRRKYGETIEEVLGFCDRARSQLAELEGLDEQRNRTRAALEEAGDLLAAESARVGAARRGEAPGLARALEDLLADLALGSVTIEVDVSDTTELPGAGEAVDIRLSTNPGMSPAPLAKVASGGELSRVMLALRLVLSGGPPTMVFDEVDAGIGGAAAVSVASALARLARGPQVLVVTHLPQVAAVADAHVLVEKHVSDSSEGPGTTTTTARTLGDDERVVELSRMLSGSPDSSVARTHAEELLRSARSSAGEQLRGAT